MEEKPVTPSRTTRFWPAASTRSAGKRRKLWDGLRLDAAKGSRAAPLAVVAAAGCLPHRPRPTSRGRRRGRLRQRHRRSRPGLPDRSHVADEALPAAEHSRTGDLGAPRPGQRHQDIARRLYLTPKTVRANLQVPDRAQAIATAREARLGSDRPAEPPAAVELLSLLQTGLETRPEGWVTCYSPRVLLRCYPKRP
jgi:hypothetical protein